MNKVSKSLLCMLILGLGIAQSAPLKPLIELTDAAKSWVVYEGHPIFYSSSTSQYSVEHGSPVQLPRLHADAHLSLSTNSEYRLVSLLQSMDDVKDGKRYMDYSILDSHNDLLYTVTRGTDSDLKPLVSAISDQGVLALVDPVRAHIYFYSAGALVAEGQLYEDDGDFSMERNVRIQWVGEECFILLERPGFNGGPAGNSLFIRINADGRDQKTAYLPFTYLQKYIFQNDRFFISGYDYSATTQQMSPQIVEVTREGQVLWSNEHFGHELVISKNGEYLAALSSHENIQRFDLKRKRVNEIEFDHDNKVALGMMINNEGELAVIRVPVDFFAKRNTHFSEIFFPLTDRNVEMQIDPFYPKLFQIHTDGSKFYVGTNYEWLEIKE